MIPAMIKIQPLYADNVASQGNVESNDTIADPPAIATTSAGSAQHISVPVEVNSAKKLPTLCCQLFVDDSVRLISLLLFFTIDCFWKSFEFTGIESCIFNSIDDLLLRHFISVFEQNKSQPVLKLNRGLFNSLQFIQGSFTISDTHRAVQSFNFYDDIVF